YVLTGVSARPKGALAHPSAGHRAVALGHPEDERRRPEAWAIREERRHRKEEYFRQEEARHLRVCSRPEERPSQEERGCPEGLYRLVELPVPARHVAEE